MCTFVYLASTIPAPLIPPESSTHLSVTPVDPADSEHRSLLRILSHHHLYFVSAHTGCGCGFQLEHPEYAEDPDDIQTSRLLLSRYLANLLKAGAHLQIYSCWAGDEHHPARTHGSITSEAIAQHSFVERELLDLG
ncbi:MAG: hypothetical protein WC718_05195 [Phycisphaerales bacterium]|jgi:hypothetical protein